MHGNISAEFMGELRDLYVIKLHKGKMGNDLGIALSSKEWTTTINTQVTPTASLFFFFISNSIWLCLLNVAVFMFSYTYYFTYWLQLFFLYPVWIKIERNISKKKFWEINWIRYLCHSYKSILLSCITDNVVYVLTGKKHLVVLHPYML